MSSTDLTDLAWDLASNGFVGRENAVRHVVRTARSHGVPSILIDVLADVTQLAVARLRAFGRVAALLASPPTISRITQAA